MRNPACRRAIQWLDAALAKNTEEKYAEKIELMRLYMFGEIICEADWERLHQAEKIIAELNTPEAQEAREAKARFEAERANEGLWRRQMAAAADAEHGVEDDQDED